MTQNTTELRIGYVRDGRDFDDFCRSEPGWELTERLSEPATDAPSEKLVVRCWAAFDVDHLYLRAEVLGRWGSDGERSWRYGDGFQVNLSPDAVNARSPRFTTLGFSIVDGTAHPVLVNLNGRWFLQNDPPAVQLEVTPPIGDVGAVYDMIIEWAAVEPVQGFIDGRFGLNITYTGNFGDHWELRQLTCDEKYDQEQLNTRQVLPVVLDTSALGAVGQVRPVCRSRCDKTHGSESEEVSIEIAYWSPRSAQVQVVLAVNGITESTRELTVEAGMNRLSQGWNSGTRQTGDYALQLQILDGSTPTLEQEYQYYQLRAADVAALRQRFDRTGADDPTVEIRFQWLDELRSTLEPGADPAPLRELFDESSILVSQLERGQNALLGVRGYQRRAFRSAIDGTLQPYSVDIPQTYSESGSPSPMLVFLHGSGVDEVPSAHNPRLIELAEEHGWVVCLPLGRDVSGYYQGDCGEDIFEAIGAAKATMNIDPHRIVLGGFSMGGYGTWRWGLARPENFAGLVVLSGIPFCPLNDLAADTPEKAEAEVAMAPRPNDAAYYLDNAVRLPVFVAHGGKDMALPIGATRPFVERIKRQGANITWREYPQAGHASYNAWPEVFDWLEQL